jgi:hypothetical protein
MKIVVSVTASTKELHYEIHVAGSLLSQAAGRSTGRVIRRQAGVQHDINMIGPMSYSQGVY